MKNNIIKITGYILLIPIVLFFIMFIIIVILQIIKGIKNGYPDSLIVILLFIFIFGTAILGSYLIQSNSKCTEIKNDEKEKNY